MQVEINSDKAKQLAKVLEQEFKSLTGKKLQHGKSLEVLSHMLGYANWDTLSGLLKQEEEPQFPKLAQPVTVFMAAHACSFHGDGPAWARLEVTDEFFQSLLKHRQQVIQTKVDAVTTYDCPDEWDSEEEYRMRDDELVITENNFWFKSWPKHADYHVETPLWYFEEFIKAVTDYKPGDPCLLYADGEEEDLLECLIEAEILDEEGILLEDEA